VIFKYSIMVMETIRGRNVREVCVCVGYSQAETSLDVGVRQVGPIEKVCGCYSNRVACPLFEEFVVGAEIECYVDCAERQSDLAT
jgi:hypothetical protein